jgi:hypothetical protein
MLYMILGSVALLSVIPHKEYRFLLPILPFLVIMVGHAVTDNRVLGLLVFT